MQHLTKYFPELSELQRSQFELLGLLYPEWNEKINVISRKDIENLYVNHILHSLSIAKFINFLPGTKVMDFGTGGGFPGIPLAVLFPDVEFHLVDRIGKKIKVASDIASQAGLTNVTFQHGDVNDVKQKRGFDFIVSRAVMELNDMVPLLKKFISPNSTNAFANGLICLKGGNLKGETSKYAQDVLIYDLKTYFEEPFFDSKHIVYLPIR